MNTHKKPARPNKRRFNAKDTHNKRSNSSRYPKRRTHSNNSNRKFVAIDENLFINEVQSVTDEEKVEIKNTFKTFGFDKRLENNILKKGFELPTPIQDQTIEHALDKKDILGLANTGTGKTAAFLLPIINSLLQEKKQNIYTLIIAPTRELAQQIDAEFKSFTKDLRLFSTICVGGLSIHKQKVQLNRKPHVVIGTPGRLKDLMQQKALNLENIKYFVLDEVDLMLDMGFIDDINFIGEQMKDEKQVFCFSATMTDIVKKVVYKVTRDPITVSVKTRDTSANVNQEVVKADGSKQKFSILLDMLKTDECEKVLIFCETKTFVQKLCDDLNEAGIKSEAIHGDKSQPQRSKALKKFKENVVSVLVATDVASRGLDIPNVSHVINYDTPRIYEDYIHRIGRTGRAGKLGKAITFMKSKPAKNNKVRNKSNKR